MDMPNVDPRLRAWRRAQLQLLHRARPSISGCREASAITAKMAAGPGGDDPLDRYDVTVHGSSCSSCRGVRATCRSGREPRRLLN